jgi:hypothetical protein
VNILESNYAVSLMFQEEWVQDFSCLLRVVVGPCIMSPAALRPGSPQRKQQSNEKDKKNKPVECKASAEPPVTGSGCTLSA